MPISIARSGLTGVLLILCLASGCPNSSVSDSPNSLKIQAIEVSIKQWKEMQESGQWEQLIAEGVATDAIDNDEFLSKPRGFPKFKIKELEERLKALKQDSGK